MTSFETDFLRGGKSLQSKDIDRNKTLNGYNPCEIFYFLHNKAAHSSVDLPVHSNQLPLVRVSGTQSALSSHYI